MEFLEHWKEKATVSFKNQWKLAGIQTNSKSNSSCVDSNLGPRCEGSGLSKDLPTLRPRVDCRNETLSLPLRGRGRWKKLVLGQKEWNRVQMNAQLSKAQYKSPRKIYKLRISSEGVSEQRT
ncbi:hypothetical protein AVEN_38371-1 [Araneus ventricosus]|uniref:Uncharacterized protein n=1 Tax=Araneus ventricosus TaxID=182803 RepID=A0A4Y2J6I9_ARAVE|nr:hypothetical protein AVEN_38371-1 [Araneus ventricosus]